MSHRAGPSKFIAPIASALLLMIGTPSANAAADAVATINADVHEGVATCASSTCHGATTPFADGHVPRNEFSRWQEYDPHATQALQGLSTPLAQSIAKKLGIGDPTAAKVCLDCHTDNVPLALRGERFQAGDGIGCEACHGGAQRWLASHSDPTVSHAENLADGLYPTEDPVARAELCMSCHVGVPERMITHRIMGAGHPRLAFELDTFTWINPHYEIDADYIERKGDWSGVRDWGVGQGVAARNAIDILLSDKHGWNGIFPELVLFDCHACHRPMGANQWAPRQGTGLGPGVVRLNDSSLVMFRHLLAGVDADAAAGLRDKTRALHRATTQSRPATAKAARALRDAINVQLPRIAAFEFGDDALARIFDSMIRDADAGEFRDFAAGEQAAMAAQSVVVAFESIGALEAADADAMQPKLDRLLDAAADADRYRMATFNSALRAIRADLR